MSPDGIAADDYTPPEGETVAMVLRHLSWLPPGTRPVPTPEERLSAQRAALDWQQLGASAEWAELHGSGTGVPEGRMSELMGRAAETGEQLGLAWTLDQELQRWHAASPQTHPGRAMATRALAEMCGYYILAAAHGLGNVTLRTLVLSRAAADRLAVLRPNANRYPPFSDTREAWPPLSAKVAHHVVEAATATGEHAAIALAELLVNLTNDGRWLALVERRDTDYHRWRPQGLPNGGVPRRSLWDHSVPGVRSLSGGARFYEPVDHEALSSAAGEALDALSSTMVSWLEVWPRALKALGVPVFKTESE